MMRSSGTIIHRGVLGNILFSFATLGSLLFVILLGNLLNFSRSWALIILFCVTLIRTGFLVLALCHPVKRRLHRLKYFILTLGGLVGFNFAFQIVSNSIRYLILEVFIHQWARSNEEEKFISNYFLDGYNEEPLGDSIWVLSWQYTLAYIIMHELFTFGMIFPFSSPVSSFMTPFHQKDERYQPIQPMPSPYDSRRQATNHFHDTISPSPSLSHRRGTYPLQLELELEANEIPRHPYVVSRPHTAQSTPAPSSPPQNPMYVPTDLVQELQPQSHFIQRKDDDNSPVKAYKV